MAEVAVCHRGVVTNHGDVSDTGKTWQRPRCAIGEL